MYGPPAVPFAVIGADATPVPSVATVIVVVLLPNKPEAPDDGAVNVTLIPDRGLFPASMIVTAGALANAVLIVADWGVVPAFAIMLEGAPAIFVNEKLTVVRPDAEAVIEYGPPATLLAVNVADAIPEAFVATVMTLLLLAKRPAVPEPGAVKVTFTPGTGLLPASLTVTARALPNAEFMTADCGVVPAFADIDAAAPTVLVSEKFTVVRPDDDAVTV